MATFVARRITKMHSHKSENNVHYPTARHRSIIARCSLYLTRQGLRIVRGPGFGTTTHRDLVRRPTDAVTLGVSKTYDTVIDIRAAPDRVLGILVDVERWPEWTSTTTSVRRLDTGPFRVGSRARVEQPKLKPAVWRVTELDDTHFTWIASGPGIRMTARHDIEPTNTGCRVRLSLEFSGLFAWLAVRVAGELTERYIAAEAAGLKKRSES